MKYISEYNYEELRAAAPLPNATQDDINALGEWFSRYGSSYWNGEYYDADGVSVHPVYEQTGDDEFELSGYSID